MTMAVSWSLVSLCILLASRSYALSSSSRFGDSRQGVAPRACTDHAVLSLSVDYSLSSKASRRVFFSSSAATLSALSFTPRAHAASYSDTKNIIGFSQVQRSLELRQRPRPITNPQRRILVQDFAVLLMRSSYSVADELDFVAMDQFQKHFFLFRQSEYLDYSNSLEGAFMMQGDLTNPLYFDFISFAQHAVVSQDMQEGKLEFPEAVAVEVPVNRGGGGGRAGGSGRAGIANNNNSGGGAAADSSAPPPSSSTISSPPPPPPPSPPSPPPSPSSSSSAEEAELRWTTEDVVRAPDLPSDNKLLPAEFDKRVGDKILQWLMQRYNNDGNNNNNNDDSSTDIDGKRIKCCTLNFFPPSLGRPSAEDVASNIRQLLVWFQMNGYMTSFDVTLSEASAANPDNGNDRRKFPCLDVTLESPATRWSQEVLGQRGSWVGNAFEVKTALAYLRAANIGAKVVRASTPLGGKFKGPSVTHRILLTKGLLQ